MGGRPKELELIESLLRKQSTLALSTTDEVGQACVAPLFYLADEDLNLYWLSSATSLHSVNLIRVPTAAATVYRDVHSWKEICGVQMRGTVTVVTDKKRRREVINAYCQRFQLGTLFRLPISRCDLFAYRPEFIRYIDNSRKFGSKIELERNSRGDWNRC